MILFNNPAIYGSRGSGDRLADAAGVVMHLDVSTLVTPTVIRDLAKKGNNATLYNTAGTALSGILNTDTRIKSMVNLLGSTGNFDNSEAWTSSNASNVQSSNEIVTTGSGANLTVRTQKIVGTAPTGDVLYACGYFKHSGSASSMAVLIRNGFSSTIYSTGTIASPTANTYYFVGTMATLPSNATSLTIGLQVLYPDAATASGKTMTNKKAHIINLSQIVASTGIPMPTKAEMDLMMQAHYDTGGQYIGATPLGSGYALKACKKLDGTDDYGRVLTPSAGTNITTEQFALGFVGYWSAIASGFIVCKNGASSAFIQYSANLGAIAAGKFTFFLNGTANQITIPTAISASTWYSVIMHRDASGNLSILIDGTVVATGTYATALNPAANLMLGCRSNSADGSAQASFSNAYTNHEFIAVGADATIENAKNFQRSHALTYVSSYGTVPITAIGAITGTLAVGNVLTAGALTPSGATVTYQWRRADTSGGTYTDISSATSSTYTLVSADTGKYLKVVATGSGSYTGSVTSAATGSAVTEAITAIGAITGTLAVGNVLTAGALTPSGATVTYQWRRADTSGGTYTDISSATSSTYTLVSADTGKYLKVVATGSGSYTGSVTSAATGSAVTEAITAIGDITGTTQVGSVLTAGALTPSGATVTYQWRECATSGGTYTDISGATSSTYTLTTTQSIKFIKVVVTGTGSYTGSATSAATARIKANISVDGTTTDWAGIPTVATASGQPATAMKVYNDDTYLYFLITGSGLSANLDLFINSDNNASTGYTGDPWTTHGADYFIDQAGVKYLSTGSGWSWTNQGTTGVTYSKSSTVFECRVARSGFASLASAITVGYVDLNGSFVQQCIIPTSGNAMASYTLLTGF